MPSYVDGTSLQYRAPTNGVKKKPVKKFTKPKTIYYSDVPRDPPRVVGEKPESYKSVDTR
jgi:hypothetical protein